MVYAASHVASPPGTQAFLPVHYYMYRYLRSGLGNGATVRGASTNHPLLKGDGLIFSPGPFSGYLAIVLPVCLNLALRFRDCDKLAWWETRTMLFYLSAFTIILILIGFPAGKPFSVAGSRNLMLLGLLSPEIRVAVIEEKGYKA